MKINVRFVGLPSISNVVGKGKLEIDIPAKTVKAVISELTRRYGEKVREAFYDKDGNLDLMIQISHNGKSFISADKHDTPLLKEGDSLMFMVPLAGG